MSGSRSKCVSFFSAASRTFTGCCSPSKAILFSCCASVAPDKRDEAIKRRADHRLTLACQGFFTISWRPSITSDKRDVITTDDVKHPEFEGKHHKYTPESHGVVEHGCAE